MVAGSGKQTVKIFISEFREFKSEIMIHRHMHAFKKLYLDYLLVLSTPICSEQFDVWTRIYTSQKLLLYLDEGHMLHATLGPL